MDLPRARSLNSQVRRLPWAWSPWQRSLSPSSPRLLRPDTQPLEATKAPLPSLFPKTSGKSLASQREPGRIDRRLPMSRAAPSSPHTHYP